MIFDLDLQDKHCQNIRIRPNICLWPNIRIFAEYLGILPNKWPIKGNLRETTVKILQFKAD